MASIDLKIFIPINKKDIVNCDDDDDDDGRKYKNNWLAYFY